MIKMLLKKLCIQLFLTCVLISSPSFSQSGVMLFRANTQIKKGNFDKGKYLLEKALAKDSLNYKANIRLGNLFFDSYQLFDSAHYYIDRGIRNPKKDTNYLDYYAMANSQRLTGRYDKALESYALLRLDRKVQRRDPDPAIDSLLDTYESYCRIAAELEAKRSKVIQVENMDFFINTAESEYTAVYFQEDSSMMFNARYKDLKKERQFADFQYMENIYIFDLEQSVASTYDESIKQNSHQAIVSRVPHTDSVVIFYKNILWLSKIVNGRLTELEELPTGPEKFFFQPHGVFNSKQDMFIFSAKDNVFEDLDLYFTWKNEDGSWSRAQKLTPLNSDFDEDSPFLTVNDSTIYFSSRGFNSSGHYDVFRSDLTENGWSAPQILPYPINSPAEDIYFTVDSESKYGYLSSNRNGGLGIMDIYQFRLEPYPDFECPDHVNDEILVSLNVKDFIDTVNADHEYYWIFLDDTNAKGNQVTKKFNSPGEHEVLIEVDDGTDDTDIWQVFVTAKSDNFIGFKSNIYYQIKEEIILDASVSKKEGYDFTNYFWAINDSILSIDSPQLTLTGIAEGDYKISVQLFAYDGIDAVSFCRSDSIHIFEKYPELDSNKVTMDTTITVAVDTNVVVENPIKDKDTSITVIDPQQKDSLIEINQVVDDFNIEPIYFGFDRHDLKRSATTKLNKLVDYLKTHPNSSIIVAGHTDNMGSDDYNIKLSERRTKSAIDYLMSKGVNNSKIVQVLNKGETDPKEPNTNSDGSDNFNGRKKNRRVEFTVLKK